MQLPAQFGRYEVQGHIGSGQMGTVYLATDPLIDRPVAVKVLRDRPEIDAEEAEEWRARFEREVQVTGKLSHPNIVGVLDVGLEGDTAFIVMEYVDGRSVEDLMEGQQSLPVGRVVDICSGVADALDHAHAHGIVHRDIKPGNVLLTRDGTPKVADFGIAHVADARLTRTGLTYGTPAFMSPEQATAKDIGPPSDQFSLAAMAYLMLAGEVPFSGATTPSIVYRLVNEDPVPVESINPAVSKEVGAALLRGLAKNPGERYANCAALAGALRAAHQGTPKTAPSVTPAATVGAEAAAATTIIVESPLSATPGWRRAALVAVPTLLAVLLFAWSYRGTEAGNETASGTTPGPATSVSSDSPEPGEAAPSLPGKLAERVDNATTTLEEVVGVAEGIPQRLLSGAYCVAVIPGVIKVGFGLGGRHGKGLVSCRGDDGWSTPSFVAITGGSFGLQLGAQSTDLVLVFASRNAAEHLAGSEITLGGDASVSAGPVGRTAEADTSLELEAEIYSYSRSKGLFAGVSLEGATLRPDKDANRDAYGRDATQEELLRGRRASIAPELAALMRMLQSAGGR